MRCATSKESEFYMKIEEPATILVVDDIRANVRVLAQILHQNSYIVQFAFDGAEALKLIEKSLPDLILLDIQMPNMDGYEVCERLKSNERTRDIPVIFISALSEVMDKVRAFSVGGLDYITKPFQFEEVLARVATHLELHRLQKLLKAENLRMSAELDVAKQIQMMILPKQEELEQIEGLDITGYMEPADEVGGDYYDVLQHNGLVKIGIGDVTGHGLESGLIMLMTQMGVRTLLASDERDPKRFLSTLNRTIYDNVERMDADRSLTLALLDYSRGEGSGQLRISGQHEEVIVVRKGGQVERIDTFDLGFSIGLDEEIEEFIDSTTVKLAPGDGVVLYTDGITEAENVAGQMYGLQRLCEVVSHHWEETAEGIKEAVIADVHSFIGQAKVLDDITLLIIKQK